MVDPTANPKYRFAETALEALAQVDQLLASPSPGPKKASPSEMHSYAVNPDHQPTDTLLQALKNSPQVQRDFHCLLNNTAQYHMPQVAAASSGQIEQREANGCKISFRPSRADAKQMYVIIESAGNLNFSPDILFVCANNGDFHRLPLPPAQNGRIQLLLDRDNEIATGLLDIKSEVYLK